MMRIVRWVLGVAVGAVVTIVAVVLLLDTFGGFLFDGPLGPIPGGAFKGPVNSDLHPDWSDLEPVIELEIRPARPWSLRGSSMSRGPAARGGAGPPLP